MSSSFQPYELTASQKARLDAEIVFCWPNWCASVAKWLFTIILAVLILCGAVASRMALVAIPLAKSDPDLKVLALIVLLMVPYGIEFVRCCWLHGFVHGHSWPSKTAFVMGFVVSVIEVFGLCYYTIAVLTLKELSATELILFTNAILILPSMKNVIRPREQDSRSKVFSAIILILNLGSLAWAIFKFSDTKTRAALPASVVLISIAWFSPLRKCQLQTSNRPTEDTFDATVIDSSSQSNNTERLLEFRHVLLNTHGQAALRSRILTSAFKLVSVPFVSAFFCHFYHVVDVRNISAYHLGPSMGIYWYYLWVNIICSVGVYLLGFLACRMGLQRQAFAVPLVLVTPVCLFLTSVHWSCTSDIFRSLCGDVTGVDHYHVLIIAAILWIGLLLYVFVYIWRPQNVKMAREKDLFLIPYSYSGVFLEQYLFLNRENTFSDPQRDIIIYPLNKANVFIATTMYREQPKIMEQYLRCLSRVSSSQRKYQSLETHIVFDDAFLLGKRSLNEHAQTFIALCKDILKGSDADTAKMVDMPYGRQIVITLQDGIQVYVHFKNSEKVKQGKRWSQMMIMSWIMDTKRDVITDPFNTYFFTCDADVAFTHSSIEKLLHVMTRNAHVGGSTCRVHAKGSGPVVWYQLFEYAIWHWVVKAANSVIGSLVCCSGCFSVFRLQALAEVLPVFSRPSENAADYLRKDLGEDRWLSCLLLKTGWQLEYCSLADVWTRCPETFDEFFQQRRHWIASSFANTCDLIKHFRQVRHFNNKLPVFFFVYLIVTVLFMIISPSVMIWMIAGSFSYILTSSALLLATGITLMGIWLVYIAACLFTLSDVHRAFAKGGSYIFAIVVLVLALASVGYGIMHSKITLTSDDPPYNLDKEMGISVAWLYIIIYGVVFTTTALLHPKEILCCLQSLWYLMCLPGFNIFFVTYTVCNLDKSNSELQIGDDNIQWYLRLLQYCSKKGSSELANSANTSCCTWCPTVPDVAEALISEMIVVDEPEKCDEGEGVEDNDIPAANDDDGSWREESNEEDIYVNVDASACDQRRYWEQLQSSFLTPYDEQALEVRKKQLRQIRNGSLLVFSIANIMWFIVDYGVHLFNPLGFASLTLFTVLIIVQFIAMFYHRLMTIAFELSNATFFPKPSDETRSRELALVLDDNRLEEKEKV